MKTITTVLFDLDGTLLPMDAKEFESLYIKALIEFTGDSVEPEVFQKAIYLGQKAMLSTDSKEHTVGQVFFNEFEAILGKELKDKLVSVLDEFYLNKFIAAKAATDYSQDMVDSVKYLKDKGLKVILATNPMLPRIATDMRIAWAGFEPHDFEDVTRFEENHYMKPSLNYYKEVLEDNNLKPEECLMVGNDVEEDLVAKELGLKTCLIDDDLLHRGSPIVTDWRGNRSEFLKFVKEAF